MYATENKCFPEKKKPGSKVYQSINRISRTEISVTQHIANWSSHTNTLYIFEVTLNTFNHLISHHIKM